MELSPVIAPLSQAFIKCERGWLLGAFSAREIRTTLSLSRPLHELHTTHVAGRAGAPLSPTLAT